MWQRTTPTLDTLTPLNLTDSFSHIWEAITHIYAVGFVVGAKQIKLTFIDEELPCLIFISKRVRLQKRLVEVFLFLFDEGFDNGRMGIKLYFIQTLSLLNSSANWRAMTGVMLTLSTMKSLNFLILPNCVSCTACCFTWLKSTIIINL